jgi:hypothetical protein
MCFQGFFDVFVWGFESIGLLIGAVRRWDVVGVCVQEELKD